MFPSLLSPYLLTVLPSKKKHLQKFGFFSPLKLLKTKLTIPVKKQPIVGFYRKTKLNHFITNKFKIKRTKRTAVVV